VRFFSERSPPLAFTAAVTDSAPWRSTISVFDPTTSWSAKWLRLGAWLPDAALPGLFS